MKIFLLFVFIFAIYPAFATEPDIPKNTTTASCADAILNTNNGDVNIEINWEPNTIPVRWYNGNTMVESNTCTYGAGLNITNPPERTGYTFRGWRVRPQIDFTTISSYFSGSTGTSYSIGLQRTGYSANTCMYTNGMGSRVYKDCSASGYKDLQIYEWKVIKGTKTIYGTGKCSAKSGNTNNDAWDNDTINWRASYSELESASGDKKYCWCQLTGYDSGNGVISRPLNSMPWVYSRIPDTCEQSCSMWCSAEFITYSGLRDALFGPAGN